MNFVLVEIMIIATLFLCPLSVLVYVQTWNVVTNSTTNMNFSKFKKLKSNDYLVSDEFIENLVIEQKEENVDYQMYNSMTSNFSK
jgi:hypothetical protein